MSCEKEVLVRFDEIEEDAQAAHTYEEIITSSKKELLATVNRDRAVIDL